MTKSFSELALNITEQEYRNLPYLSYSTIAKYEKEGFGSIPHLFDTQESEYLLFGSMVDTIITEGLDKFNEKYSVVSFNLPSESIEKIADIIFNYMLDNNLHAFGEVDDATILDACNQVGYNARLKDSTRIDKVKTEGAEYISAKILSVGKTIVSAETYQEVIDTVAALKNHPTISKYLGKSNGEVEILYQNKFVCSLEGEMFKCMPDILVVLHDKKIVLPVDLKTSSFPEYDFPKRYLENRYDIQSRLYCRILNTLMQRDEYFKDFSLGEFRFIVVNKFSKTPLIFRDEKCDAVVDVELVFQSGRKFILRDPVTIGKELHKYLDEMPKVPNGISIDGSNYIHERLKLL